MPKMETGPTCVRPSTYVGIPSPDPGPDRLAGITSMTPLETVPTAARYSDNSGPPSMTHDLNAANDRARRTSGTVFMPPTSGTGR